MAPPPTEERFSTWEEALAYVNQWSKDHGYCVRVKTSNKARDKVTIKSKVLECDQAGKYIVKGKERRHPSSKAKDCKFICRINLKDGEYYCYKTKFKTG